jgi:ribosome-binding factor A
LRPQDVLRPHSKCLQLCAQVEHALLFALGESNDPILLDLVLDGVEPLHGDGHLLVRFVDPAGHGIAAALAALDRARGFLRAAVADAIARRRVPQLSFTVVPGGAR